MLHRGERLTVTRIPHDDVNNDSLHLAELQSGMAAEDHLDKREL